MVLGRISPLRICAIAANSEGARPDRIARLQMEVAGIV
jgi:hypothetical protein